MIPVLLETLVLASGGIVSVGSITIVILLLISDGGWRNGLAYVLGYVGAYSLIGLGLVLSGVGEASGASGPAGGSAGAIATLVLGALLLWMSARNWRKPEAEVPEPPRIFGILDGISMPKALAFGAVVTVINVKNLAIFLSAISVVLVSQLPLGSKFIVAMLAVLVFCSSVIVPLLIYALSPRRASERLLRIKRTLEAHSRPIGIFLPLLFGLLFLFRGLSGWL